MNSRTKILSAIRNNKPTEVDLPDIPLFNQNDWDVIECFQQMIQVGGGQAIVLENENLEYYIQTLFPTANCIASTINSFTGNVDLNRIQHPHELENVDLAVIPAQLGVSENGAVWVTEQDCVHRVLPFITQYLVVVIKKNCIVQNMHEAYQQIIIDETGFGVFIAGPSKTADIEQSLVIGAQGARSLTVFIA